MTPFAPYLICEADSERNSTVSTSHEAHFLHDVTHLDQKNEAWGCHPSDTFSISTVTVGLADNWVLVGAPLTLTVREALCVMVMPPSYTKESGFYLPVDYVMCCACMSFTWWHSSTCTTPMSREVNACICVCVCVCVCVLICLCVCVGVCLQEEHTHT